MELTKVGPDARRTSSCKEIATADTIAVFADPSVAAVGTYEPFMSQAVQDRVTDRNPRSARLVARMQPGIIIDIITAREDDLAENPEKYKKFLRCIYRAVDFLQDEPGRIHRARGAVLRADARPR